MMKRVSVVSLFVVSVLSVAGSASAACPNTNPSTASEYKPSRPQQSVCTAADTAAVLDAMNKSASYESFVADITEKHAACASCILSDVGDGQWGAGVKDPNDPYGFFFNSGGCMELNGASVACAELVTEWNHCQFASCSECTTDSAWDTCTDAVIASKDGYCQKYNYRRPACPHALEQFTA